MVAIKPLLAQVPAGALGWILAGGLAYSLGTVFSLWRAMKYHHAVWHVFVLAGTFCHFWAVYVHLGPIPATG